MKKLQYFLITFILLVHFTSLSFSAILTVNKTTGPYYYITNALIAAQPGDTIEITDNSVYSESITIGISDITLQGAEGYRPTIRNSGITATIQLSYVSNVYIKNLIIYNNVDMHCIQIDGGSFNVIENCEIDGSALTFLASGINLYDSANNRIFNCRIHNFYSGIYVDCMGIPNTTYVFYNEIYNCTNGISLSAFEADQHIYNNTLVKNKEGIVVVSPYNTPGLNIYIKNNISYFNQVHDISFIPSGISYNSEVSYNCFSSLSNGSPAVANVNELNNINQDPLFVNFADNNFQLSASSPCIDAGVNIDYSTLYGINFPVYGAGRDIGANEYFGVVLPPDRGKSKYIRLSSNNFTTGEQTSIYIVNLNEISEDSVFLKVGIFDLRGKKIKKLYEGTIASSQIVQLNWDGRNENNQYGGAGLYILKVQINNITTTEKIFFVP